MRLFLPLTVACIALASCTPKEEDTASTTGETGPTDTEPADADEDGFTVADGDCDDEDASVHPGAEEVWYDGVDQDCDGGDDYDQDGDGEPTPEGGGADCDDLDAAIHPDASEVWYDGVDQNCDGADDFDQDADGEPTPEGGGADCDDLDAAIHPAAKEIWYDGVDQDCDGANDYDQDADGHATPEGGGLDCDDLDPAVNPGMEEVWYDGIDQDCDGNDEDQDGDGYLLDEDCNDEDPLIFPGAYEIWYDGVDQNCDGLDDYDQDGDGELADGFGGADCDDLDPAIHPGASEIWYDGVDQDCDGLSDYDQDLDGHDTAAGGGRDCDDLDPSIHPDATEIWYDGVDQDCDGASDDDQDMDGYDVVEAGGEDCDDLSPVIYPGASDVWYDGVDSDCGGDSDYDQDGDGFDSEAFGGADCDDEDPAYYPGAYDRPDDGLDQDCDGSDRSFDGIVLDEGISLTETIEIDIRNAPVDVGLVLDITCSMSSAVAALDPSAIISAIETTVPQAQIGLAIYQDYPTSGFGETDDLPFQLRAQITDDIPAVETALGNVAVSGGADGPESTMEALHQAMTGAGYDMDCDGTFDAGEVRPFIADPADPFGGALPDVYDPLVSGAGDLGGMGFRPDVTRFVVYITDNYLRDPDEGYPTPGGCPFDAGSSDVAAATSDLDAWVIGVDVGATAGVVDQMVDLATATGSLADLDADGLDDPLVFDVDASMIQNAIVRGIDAIVGTGGESALVTLETAEDPYGVVSGIAPPSYSGIDLGLAPVSFDISLDGVVPAAATVTEFTLEFDLIADGLLVYTERIEVEVPPVAP